MIYLSAQPDELFFIWQLKVFVNSLYKNNNVAKNEIHILLGYEPEVGISSYSQQFISDYGHLATICAYPDTRKTNVYVSALRPHILTKHFKNHVELCKEVILYHDSDIALTTGLNIDDLLEDDVWYLSNTEDYLNADYLLSKGGNKLISDMAKIIGIDDKIVYENNKNTGGAQYLMKNVTYEFWEKVENDAEKLFIFLGNEAQNSELDNPIQAWCADMWALLWNAYYFNFQTKVIPKLSFCWPGQLQCDWESNAIYHDAGATEDVDDEGYQMFVKHLFHEVSPFYINYKKCINPGINSYKYVQMFSELVVREDISDSGFLIVVNSDDLNEVNHTIELIDYINSYFETSLFILEYGNGNGISERNSMKNVFVRKINNEEKDKSGIGKLNNQLFEIFYEEFLVLNIKYLIFIRPNIRFIPDQVYISILKHRYEKIEFSIPHNGEVCIIENEISYSTYRQRSTYESLDTKIDFDFFVVNENVYKEVMDSETILGLYTSTKNRYLMYEGHSRDILNIPIFKKNVHVVAPLHQNHNLNIYIDLL